MKRRAILALAGSLLLAAGAAGQLPKPEAVVEARAELARLKLAAGAAAEFTVVATILEGFHINSNKPLQDYLIPSRLELAEASGFELEKAAFPAGELKSFGFAPDDKLSVYEGTVKVPARLRAKPGTAPGNYSLKLLFHFQACNDEICLRPARREIPLTVRVQ